MLFVCYKSVLFLPRDYLGIACIAIVLESVIKLSADVMICNQRTSLATAFWPLPDVVIKKKFGLLTQSSVRSKMAAETSVCTLGTCLKFQRSASPKWDLSLQAYRQKTDPNVHSSGIFLSSGLLRGVQWFQKDVSGLPIGPIIKGQTWAAQGGLETTFRDYPSAHLQRSSFMRLKVVWHRRLGTTNRSHLQGSGLTRRKLVLNRRFGTTNRSHLQGSRRKVVLNRRFGIIGLILNNLWKWNNGVLMKYTGHSAEMEKNYVSIVRGLRTWNSEIYVIKTLSEETNFVRS